MDIGLDKVMEMVEERFGRRPVTVLVFLLYAAIVAFCINTVWNLAIKPIFDILGKYIVGPEITIVSVFYSTAFIAALIILYPVIGAFFSKRKVSQAALDKLADLRAEGINTVYASPVANEAELAAWRIRKAEWEKKLREYIKGHFPKADYEFAANLGVVPLQNNLTATNREHVWELSYVVRQLDLVEQILNSYRR